LLSNNEARILDDFDLQQFSQYLHPVGAQSGYAVSMRGMVSGLSRMMGQGQLATFTVVKEPTYIAVVLVLLVEDLPEKVPLEGGLGSSLVGISLTSLSIIIMAIAALFPQSSLENFILSLITASSLLGTGSIVLTLVSDYALILSSASIFFLLLFWRLRNIDSLWILSVSIFCFVMAIVVHRKTSDRRGKGRARRSVSP